MRCYILCDYFCILFLCDYFCILFLGFYSQPLFTFFVPIAFNGFFFYNLLTLSISIEYSSLFIIVINLVFIFRFDALPELGAFMRTEFNMYFYIKSSSIGTQGEVG